MFATTMQHSDVVKLVATSGEYSKLLEYQISKIESEMNAIATVVQSKRK